MCKSFYHCLTEYITARLCRFQQYKIKENETKNVIFYLPGQRFWNKKKSGIFNKQLALTSLVFSLICQSTIKKNPRNMLIIVGKNCVMNYSPSSRLTSPGHPFITNYENFDSFDTFRQQHNWLFELWKSVALMSMGGSHKAPEPHQNNLNLLWEDEWMS